MAKRVVIVGGVAVGMKTASRLRRRDKDAEIIVLERGSELSYSACGFPYFISGAVPDFAALDHTPQGAQRDVEYFSKVKGIDARTGCNVTAIDKEKKIVSYTEKGVSKTITYDELVLGTGATPIKLSLEGADAVGIHNFWLPSEVLAVERELVERRVTDAAIIGAGLIGMELAEAFCERGLKVAVVEMQPQLLPQMLDKEIADWLLPSLTAHGLNLYLGEKTLAFTAEQGIVTGLQTDKRWLPAQLVVVAAGVRPNVELARAAGLKLGPTGCIAVDEYLQTSAEHIYAGGDCVENVNRVSGAKVFAPMGSTANKHGRIIADNICGDKKKFPGVLNTGICRLFEVEAAAVGLNERTAVAAKLDFESIIVPGNDRLPYMPGVGRLVLKLLAERSTQRILGAQAVGQNAAKRIDTLVAAISLGATLDDLSNFDIAYAPPFNGPIDNIATAANVLQNKIAGRLHSINPRTFLHSKDSEDYLFVDVRTAPEVAAKRIAAVPQRVNLPLGELRERGLELAVQNKKIVTCCQINLRGYEAETILRAQGYTNVKSLEGGMQGWPYATESD